MSSVAGPSSAPRSRKAPERLMPSISWKELDASGYADSDGDGGDDDDDGDDDSGEDFSDEEDYSGSDSDYDDRDGAKGGNLDDENENQDQVPVQSHADAGYQTEVRGIWRDKLHLNGSEEYEEGLAGDELADVEPGGKEAISGLLARVQEDGEGPSSQHWEADAAAFQNDLRRTAGFKTAKKDGRGRGRGRARVELSGEVKQLLGEATLAFVEANEREAIKILKEVIQIEPGALQAWTLLRNCFLELKEDYKAIQVGIIVALMSSRPNALWRELAEDSRSKGLLQQALFCYQEAIKADRKDLLSMWERGELLEELGLFKRAAEQFMVMWKQNLYDAEIRDKIVDNWIAAEEWQRVATFSSDCFEHAKKFFPKGDLPRSNQERININAIRGNLSLAHARALLANGNFYSTPQLHSLAEAYLWIHQYGNAIEVIRQGARWLQGRAHEKFWDEVEDDREYDDNREDPTGGKREGKKGRAIDRAPVHPLDDDLRLSLGRARLSSGELQEAKRHFEILTKGVDPDEYSGRFIDIADQYIEAQMWDEAISVMNAVLSSDEVTHRHHHVENYSRLASAYYAKGDLKAAANYYESIVDTEKDDLNSKFRLAEILEELGDRYRALQLVNEVVRARQALQHAENKSTDASLAQEAAEQSQQQLESQLSFFDEVNIGGTQSGQNRKSSSSKSGVRKMTATQRQKLEKQREEQAQDMWASLRLQEDTVFSGDWWHRDVMLDGELTEEEERKARRPPTSPGDFSDPRDKEERAGLDRARRIVATRDWMETAHTLIEGFRGTRALFPRDRTIKFRGVVRNTRRRKRKDLDSQATELMSRIQDRMYNEADEEEEEQVREHTSFRGVNLDEWIELFMQYALVLTKVGDYEAAKEMFNDVVHSNVVHNSEERKLALTLCQCSCALYAKDYDQLFLLLRTLPTTYQFIDEPLRLIAAVANVTNVYGMKSFTATGHSKVYQRRLRLIETVAARRYHIFSNLTNRWSRPYQHHREKARSKSIASAGSGSDRESHQEQDQDESEMEEEEEEDVHQENDVGPMGAPTASERLARRRYGFPTKNSPIGEVFYGSLLLTGGKTYASALTYYLRAYAREPQDALTCLLIATTCLGRVTPREVDNRHQLVLQAMTFMSLYRDAREGSNQETEYNFGRAFHHLGLLHLAVPHYKKVLRLQEESTDEGVDTVNAGFEMYKEAAYNLSLIYNTSGNASLARALHEKWLTV